MTERNLALSPMRMLPRALAALLALLGGALAPAALAADATVTLRTQPDSGEANPGFRYTLEEDVTWPATPGPSGRVARDANGAPVRTPDPTAPDGYRSTLAVELHKSYSPVARTGHLGGADGNVITGLDPHRRYYISVIPDSAGNAQCANAADNCYTMSGTQIEFRDASGALYNSGNPATGNESVTVQVTVTKQPLPTAQIFLRAFEDIAPINNVWDNGEPNLGGWSVFLYDAGGQLSTDVYGNPLGTTYKMVGGVPVVARRGDGTIHTMTEAEANDPARNPEGLAVGEALIKHIAPGKYGVRMVVPQGQGWVQTSTIEGTRGIDMWVKAGEPRYFAEFGPASHHGEFGFIRKQSFGPTGTEALAELRASRGNAPGYAISGQVVNKHMSRPPQYDFFPGHPLAGCWVGLNDSTGTRGLYAAPCDANSNFTIPGVPDGTYQMVFWDDNLINILEMQLVTVAGADVTVNAAAVNAAEQGKIKQFGWFGTHYNYVFLDENGDGKRQPNEAGIPDQIVNLRYRDGSIYGGAATDTEGFVPFEEVFPFFSWLVQEVDFARFKPTGLTVTVDAGGPIDPNNPYGLGRLTPQIQSAAEGDPATGLQTRTEVGPVLTQGYNTFLGVTDVFEWGKQPYAPGENGGISGMVQYATTRAEDDPRYAGAETWEPGIPRVQVNLYQRDAGLRSATNPSGIVDVNQSGAVELADVDNFPFGWADGSAPMGSEDEDKNAIGGAGAYSAGDAIAVVYTDSFDDSPPEGCRPHNDAAWAARDNYYFPVDPLDPDAGGRCFDGLRNYNQARPAVFDGGYAFTQYNPSGWNAALPAAELDALPLLPSGDYVVEANAPRAAGGALTYRHQDEASKNVDFGDTFTVNPLALPPECVGDAHTVPTELTLFPGVEAKFGGQERPLCDRKQTLLVDGKNAGVNFFMYTEVPVTGHIQGFVLNDLANEFDPNSPNLGEKYAPSWIPVSVRDYAGNEVYHTYTDEFGNYNAIVPSTFRINAPTPSGVSPNMLQVCLNSPFMPDRNNPGQVVPDPYHNKQYTQFCYTLNFQPGQTTYLDTPVMPVSAFAGPHNWQLDCEQPDGTPTVSHVEGGPVIRAGQSALTIRSMGTLQVPNPYGRRVDGSNAELVNRDLGFGAAAGTVAIGGTGVNPAWVSWSDAAITITCPNGCDRDLVPGQLQVVSASGRRAVAGITISVQQAGQAVLEVGAGQRIQDAIDTAKAGDIVLVGPGNYQEMLIVTKPIALQGWGAGVTVLNPVQSPSDAIARWRAKVNELANCSQQYGIGLLPGQPNNTAATGAPCGHVPNTGLFAGMEGAGVLIAPRPGVFTPQATARVDGFTITGADQSAGVLVNAYASGVEISNNQVANNQGPAAAGIRVGQPALLDANELPVGGENAYVRIHHNRVIENGGMFEPGAGIGLYTGSDGYEVRDNFVCGNFAQASGGGIAHYGLSQDGTISDNLVVFNQSFDQTAGAGGHGGGILLEGYAGVGAADSPGTGSVAIERNTVIGNNAGSGEGGGVALRLVNGADVVASPANADNWYEVSLVNNIIANNVAGANAGGLSLLDALNVIVANNTIANNDSSGTILTDFVAHPAGVYAHANVQPGLVGLGVVGGADKSFSNPSRFTNNIIIGNRASHWAPGAAGVVATLVTDGYWNLGSAAGKQLVPTYSLLGSSAFAAGANASTACPAAPLADNNRCVEDATAALVATLFQFPYVNGDPAGVFQQTTQPAGTVNQPEFNNAGLTGAAATDEGGNFIDVHYGPLTISAARYGTTTVAASSYLLGAGASATAEAVNAGTPQGQAPTRIDIERQSRTGRNDIGADEREGTVRNLEPVLDDVRWTVSGGRTFTLQLAATDPEGGPLTYSIAYTNPPSQPAQRIGPYPNQRPSISASGLLTWNVPNLALLPLGNCFTLSLLGPSTCVGATISVTDNAGNTTLAQLTTTMYRTNAPPQIVGAPLVVERAARATTFSYAVVATDPEGTALSYTIQSRPAVASNATLTGNLLSWAIPANAALGNANIVVRVRDANNQTADLTVRVQVVAPPTVRTTGGNATPVTQTYTANATSATVAAPGLLAGFTGGSGPLSIVVPIASGPTYVRPVGLATSPGELNVVPDGSFTFTPAADFAGRATFAVQATDGVGTTPTALSVFINRELAATSMRFIAGRWVFDGRGVLPTLPGNWATRTAAQRSRTLTFRRAASAADPQVRVLGSATVTVDLNGAYAWSFARAAGGVVPTFQPGDVVNITANGTPGNGQNAVPAFTLAGLAVIDGAADAPRSTAYVQCPIDTDGDGAVSAAESAAGAAQGKVCRHLAAGDGFARMADGKELYTFGFSDVTGQAADKSIDHALLNAQIPGPSLVFNEGDEVYLTLTNVGMLKRPDLFDPHSVHFHGFPNAGAVFDGVPDSSFGINMGFSLTYYYDVRDPGTYMYHCHVEAAEHMQMGMLGNLYVKPRQNGTPVVFGGKTFTQFAYNDVDGSTGYDVEVPIQLTSMDSAFHDEHIAVQPLPFANMHDDYPMMNGRGYPDTVLAGAVQAPQAKLDEAVSAAERSESSQAMNSRIEAVAGQKILLRISNLSVTQYFTVGTTGLPMQVVGTGAHILRGPGGRPLYYGTQSVTLGGGEGADVLIDTTGVAPGTYLLYSTNLNQLSNGKQDFGGLMTEIVIR